MRLWSIALIWAASWTAAAAQPFQPIIDVHKHASWPGADDAAARRALLAQMDAEGIVLTMPAGPILRRLESIEWLTAKQRRAILYDNAARFLRLDAETVARHHTR